MKCATLLLMLLPFASVADEAAAGLDPATGLVIEPGWLHVRAHCGGCHSHALVTAQRGDRDTWLGIIRWMQATQNLWQLAPDVETEMLEYLASAYAPLPPRRRAPIPESLMPGNDG